eukprot:maker-scaffold196_size269943-snap-gene-1.34 protein:Tk08147 transcript:maker-scaffold196_size269943-snap-gene-1.34-mRNA-1 annotation:"inositol polyphosphate 1-phosphatase"
MPSVDPFFVLCDLQEKTGDEKNVRFTADFKTLADVLIQETVRHDIGRQYPTLAENIKGEESNKFTNTLNETIAVKVCDTQEETSALLFKVLDQDQVAADLLSKHVHLDTSELSEEIRKDLEQVPDIDLNVDQLGIWIDPIDSTNNYIKGCSDQSQGFVGDREIVSNGLQVVTVLIGVFDQVTGEPVMGIVHQPFAEYNQDTNTWRGQVYWGIHHQGQVFHSSSLKHPEGQHFEDFNRIVVSLSESATFTNKLKDHYVLFPAAGAGYKLLCVAKGWAKLYVSERGSTYKWDSCAVHAILRSLGGGCLDYSKRREGSELQYLAPNEGSEGISQWSNTSGLLAYRSRDAIEHVLNILDQN